MSSSPSRASSGAARSTRSCACAGRCCPATIAPVIFLLGMSGQFGRLTGLDGFPTDSYLSWILPVSCLQGAGFAGAATGANLARDIEQGWFDRLLVAPVPRPILVLGPILGAVTRSMVPTTVVLVVGLLDRRRPHRRRPGLIALYVAAASFCAIAGLWGVFMAVTFRTQQAGPADAAGRVPRRVPLDGVHAARCCCAAGSARRRT